jgi:hypothetical protein
VGQTGTRNTDALSRMSEKRRASYAGTWRAAGCRAGLDFDWTRILGLNVRRVGELRVCGYGFECVCGVMGLSVCVCVCVCLCVCVCVCVCMV